jgi:hypothetical protein
MITPERFNGIVLVLCAMALASPLVEPVPGNLTIPFWLSRAAGVSLALAGLVRPRLQRAALAGVAVLLVAVPAALQAWMRAWTGPATWCHDSVVQFEEAIRMVRAGRNPYAEDFSGTALPRWRNWADNPAIHHFVYPPFLLELSIPVEAASRAVVPTPKGRESIAPGFYDQRIVLLAFFAGLLAVLHALLRDHPCGVGLAALVALNPWVGPFVVEGRNDVAPLFFVVAAALAWRKGREKLGLVLAGLAVASKTLFLPAVPFLAVAARAGAVRAGALLLAPLVATSLPFAAADPGAFYDDLLGAPSGGGPHPFEIRGWGGLGFANLVLALGLVSSPRAWFPFSIFQAAAGAPVLVAGLRRLRRQPSWGGALLASSALIFVLLFFGRFIHDNYIGTLLSTAVLGGILREAEGPAAAADPAVSAGGAAR